MRFLTWWLEPALFLVLGELPPLFPLILLWCVSWARVISPCIHWLVFQWILKGIFYRATELSPYASPFSLLLCPMHSCHPDLSRLLALSLSSGWSLGALYILFFSWSDVKSHFSEISVLGHCMARLMETVSFLSTRLLCILHRYMKIISLEHTLGSRIGAHRICAVSLPKTGVLLDYPLCYLIIAGECHFF
jgi:hypothetical protein